MIRVLRDQSESVAARRQLRELGCDTSIGWRRFLFKTLFTIRYRSSPPPVDLQKSWDVWWIVDTIQRLHPDRNAAILDVGSFNSEIPLALWSLGYRRIFALDLDARGRSVNWYGNAIRFRRENFYDCRLPAESLDVITAVSTIEHGYDQDRLLGTARRLLRPGGTLCLTTDYREEKIAIDPSCRPFGLSYQIFSRKELESLLHDAAQYGFAPAGELDWGTSEHPVEWLGNKYTFVFLGLVKGKD